MRKSFNGKVILGVLITILLSLALWKIGNYKSGFHIDEISTFMLSNRQTPKKGSAHVFSFDEGKIYNGESIWSGFTSVKENKYFDYKNVFRNQSRDVHPPLYYLLIHTLCSLLPQASEFQVGLLINIPLTCIIFWQLSWIALRLGSSLYTSLLLSACYILGAESIGFNVVFFRMYALLTVWVNFLAMIFLKYKPEDSINIKYCLSFALVLLGGTMTQYYFLIYAFFICCIYAVFTTLNKNWRKLITSIGISVIMAGVSVFTFPSMTTHIFKGYRGQEAFSNAFNISHLWKDLWTLLNLVDKNLLAGLFITVLSILLCLLIISPKKRKFSEIKEYILLILPAIFYIVAIALVAPYKINRYITCVLGYSYIAVLSFMVSLARDFSQTSDRFILILACLILFSSHRNTIPNLYLADNAKNRITTNYKDSICMVITEDKITATTLRPSLAQLRLLNRIVFIKEKNWNKQNEIRYDTKSLIVFLSKDLKIKHNDILNTLKIQYGLKSVKKLYDEPYGIKVYSVI